MFRARILKSPARNLLMKPEWYPIFFRLTQFDGIRKFHEFQISRLFDFANEKSSSRWSWVQTPVHFFSIKTIFHYFFQYTCIYFPYFSHNFLI
jgi:hypothetical protein